jgi:hypothetical protein
MLGRDSDVNDSFPVRFYLAKYAVAEHQGKKAMKRLSLNVVKKRGSGGMWRSCGRAEVMNRGSESKRRLSAEHGA